MGRIISLGFDVALYSEYEYDRGGAAFGESGGFLKFPPRAEHYAGPIANAEIENLPGDSEVGIEAGYAFAVGAAKDESKDQFRLLLEWEMELGQVSDTDEAVAVYGSHIYRAKA